MPRITLAHWHAGRAPGEDIDVSVDELAQLRRDGRVAAVLDEQPAPDPAPAEVEPEHQAAEPEPVPEQEEAAPPSRRKR
ncbi:hypothetical protein [Streptomyces phaeochromogenes]|uniref:hypothetical protein n=1 Tax=Streptomyces phaeochromogenes TaxID=1923 RepID=UPI002DDC5DD3|nr:hypothetical protein [Streptomyces phaeochromogenes]WRZ30172.1 hypothetical protein OG931_21700 [Streptomyces phaeochromogenes]